MKCRKEIWAVVKSTTWFNPLKTVGSEGLETQSLKGVGSCIVGFSLPVQSLLEESCCFCSIHQSGLGKEKSQKHSLRLTFLACLKKERKRNLYMPEVEAKEIRGESLYFRETLHTTHERP